MSALKACPIDVIASHRAMTSGEQPEVNNKYIKKEGL